MHVGCLLLSEHSESYKIQLTFPKGKKFGIQRCPYLRVVLHIVIPQIVSTETILFEFGFMYCDLRPQYIKVEKLFKGEDYSRAETIGGNTVCTILNMDEINLGTFEPL